MVWIRFRKLRTGTFAYVVTGKHERQIPCGKGKEGREYAQDLVSEILKLRRDQKAGRLPPAECLWRLSDARAAHLDDARRRGLRTALPQRGGRISGLESHWNNLVTFFGNPVLDQITPARIRAYVVARESARPLKVGKGRGSRLRGAVSAHTINQDLFVVLRPALALAATREESGFHGDPFANVSELAPKPRRRPIAVEERVVDGLVRACWRRSAALGAHVELLRETASRLHESPRVEGGLLKYPPYKRGRPRAFRMVGRLPLLFAAVRRFDRRLWNDVVRQLKIPDFRPHDLRHSVLTILGRRPGMSLVTLLNYGGWKDPAMAGRYLHPETHALEPASRVRSVSPKLTGSASGGRIDAANPKKLRA